MDSQASHRHRRRRKRLGGVLFLLLAGLWQSPLPAQPAPVGDSSTATRQRGLEDESAALDASRAGIEARRTEIQRLRSGQDQRPVDAAMVDEARLALDSARVQQESARLDAVAAERRVSDLQGSIQRQDDQLKSLRSGGGGDQSPATREEAIATAEAALRNLQNQLALQRQQLDNLNQRADLARQRQTLAEEWYSLLQERYLSQQERSRKQALEDFEQRLAKAQEEQMARANKLREQLRQLPAEGKESERLLLEGQIQEVEEGVYLLQLQLKGERLRTLVGNLEQALPDLDVSGEVLDTARTDLGARLGELRTALDLARRKQSLLQQQIQVLEKRQALSPEIQKQVERERQLLDQLAQRFDTQIKQLEPLLEQAQGRFDAIDAAYRESVKRGLTVRHRLPGDLGAWGELANELAGLPRVIADALLDTAVKLRGALAQADVGRWLLFALLEMVLLAVLLPLWRMGTPDGAAIAATDNFTLRFIRVGLALLHGSRLALLVGGSLLLVAWITGAAPPAQGIILLLGSLWLGTVLLVGLSRWLLVSELVPDERRQHRMHRLVRGVTVVAALFAVVVMLGHLGFFSTTLRDLFDRLFMVFLLPLIFVSLRLRTVLMDSVRERMRRQWAQLLSLLSFTVPLSMLAAAVLGLVGFINLAWSVALHMGWLLLVLFVWLLVRGVMRDLVNTLKSLMVERTRNGLLWAQGVIDPLQKLARVVLALAALAVLFRLYGWGAESAVVVTLKQWLDAPLFSIGDISVTLRQLLGTALTLVVVIWLGRWARQFTYRWLYARISDLGVRNSLSVFTQYALVLLGVLVALNTMGIDLTSLAIFAGALGVGIGFGLQNIANNFISGIILLVERPIRTSDWVTISSNQGEVTRIGMRSVTVTTWDNQDVIIPNADIISTAFINWTRSDNYVRTVFQVGVHYRSDPRLAQKAMLDAVTAHPAVVAQPEARVFLVEFGTSSVDFRVQYFVDVRRNSPFQVKSEILFAIWDALAQAGIEIPFPQQDLYIKEWPEQPRPPADAELPEGTT
jgi:potassium efflux system protein